MAVITFAHRGARIEEPENTLAAFARALTLGAGGIETDVRLSGDGLVVCSHDAVIGRGRRRIRIDRTPAAELAEHGIPRLDEVYGQLGSVFECSVDVKDPAATAPLLEVAAAHGALERLWLCSPDLGLLTTVRAEPRVRLVHSVRRAEVSAPLERHAHDLGAAGIDAMNLHHTEWTAGLVSLFHRFGVLAFAWDTQETRHLRAALGMGIDAVYCDRPERMVAVVGEWGER
ncbi:MAG: glycerophosphodiester phosphodiesterase [Actinomycetota bacterium]